MKKIIKIKFRGNLLPFSCGIFCLLFCYTKVLQDYNFARNLAHVRKVYYREERIQTEAVREANAYEKKLDPKVRNNKSLEKTA